MGDLLQPRSSKLLSQICFSVGSLKNLHFRGLKHGKAASIKCFDTSCILSLIDSMLSCIELIAKWTHFLGHSGLIG